MSSARASIRPLALPQVPESLVREDGSPRFGVYEGIPKDMSLSGLGKPYGKNMVGEFLRHKRWLYFFAATDEVIIVGGVVDAGPTGTGFLMVTDRATGDVLADASRPGGTRPLVRVGNKPLNGHRSHYLLPATLMTMTGDDIELRIQATYHQLPFVPMLSEPWIDLDLCISTDVHPGVTAVTEVIGERPLVTTTAKNAALPTRGQLSIHKDGQTTDFNLAEGVAGFDYTSGYLPRETSWRWAFTTGKTLSQRDIGINVVSGFTGIEDNSYENMVWIDGSPHRLDPACRIRCDLDEPLKPWSINTEDGAVDLQFHPLAVHKEGLNLGAVRSRFIQPTGHFTGSVRVGGERHILDALPGVVEDQDVLW